VTEIPGLMRYARSLTTDPRLAEDLVADTVLRALEHQEQFHESAQLRTWLHRILHNLFVDHLRHQARLPAGPEFDAEPPVGSVQDPADAALAAIDAEEVHAALVHLPVAVRGALVLHDAQGFTDAEVAEILGISLPAAKQRIRRGRQLLMAALAEGPARRRANHGVPLSCAAARRDVVELLDGRLPDPERSLLEEHLTHCASCPPLYQALVGLPGVVGGLHDPDSVIPPALAKRLRAQLAHASPPRPSPSPGGQGAPNRGARHQGAFNREGGP
jgi:RNA polymerase sigma-70 factor (ECF subfamily)